VCVSCSDVVVCVQALSRHRPNQYSRFTAVLSDLSQSIRLVRIMHADLFYTCITRTYFIYLYFDLCTLCMWLMLTLAAALDSFSALTLLVVWQEGHPICKNWAVRYWRGYLSGARCKWYACGPTDATATPSSVARVKSRMIYVSGAGLTRLSWKQGR